HELAAVVHGEGEADRVRHDRRAARPGLDDFLGARRVGRLDLLHEVAVDERTLLDATRHDSSTLRSAPADDHPVGSLVVARLQPLGELAPRRARMPAAGAATFAAAHRVIDRVHGDAAVVGTAAEPARAPGLADDDVGVLDVADLADGGAAVEVHL